MHLEMKSAPDHCGLQWKRRILALLVVFPDRWERTSGVEEGEGRKLEIESGSL